MDGDRLKRLASALLADVLAVGSVATAGPALSPVEEGEVLRGIELRVARLVHGAGLGAEADDAEVRSRFRQAHPDLFHGSARDRHRAATRRDGD